MTFDEMLDQVRELLRTRQRVTYQALKLRFGLDDAFVDGLKAELIKAERVAADEDGEVLVWTDDRGLASSVQSLNQTTQDWHSVPQKSPRAARGPLCERGRFRSPPLRKGG